MDLPQPEWPMMETNSPLSMARLMSRSTSVVALAAAGTLVDVVELEEGPAGLSRAGLCAGSGVTERSCSSSFRSGFD